MPTLRHLYPGGNTAYGFFSYFDQILPVEKAKRIFILKGGPGVGKSTFMRKMSRYLIGRGFDVEHFRCAGDNDSLDGVLAPKLGLLFVDGTAPHVVDPKWPGAVDGIVNLGECLDEDGLAQYREQVAEISAQITVCYQHAYRYLHAANIVRSDSCAIFSACQGRDTLRRETDALVSECLADGGGMSAGTERKLFASAITPGGVVCTLSSQPARRYVAIRGPWPAPAEIVLGRLRDEALRRNLCVEGFYCALDPNRLEHLLIPSLDTLFYTDNPFHGQDLPFDRAFDLSAHILVPTPREAEALTKNEGVFQTLLDCAVGALSEAKSLHDALEKHYVKHMDFSCFDAIYEKTLRRLQPLLPS